MTQQAELFDGTVLEFPDGTAPDVVRRVAKAETQRRRAAAPAPPAASTRAIQFEGRNIQVPHDATDDEVREILSTPSGAKPPADPWANFRTSPPVAPPVAPPGKDEWAAFRSAPVPEGPWTRYAQPAPAAAPRAAPSAPEGPWTRYAPPAPAAAPSTDPIDPTAAAITSAPAAAPTSVYRGSILPFERMSDGTREWAVPGVISDTINALRLPERVASGAIDPMSEEGMQQTVGLAGLVTGGTMPMGPKALVNGAGKAVPDAVMSALRADGVPMGEVASRVQALGPAGFVADLGPNLRFKAAALATRPGEAQTTVVEAMRARQKVAPARVTGAIDETLGPAKVPDYIRADIDANKQTLGPEYDRALAGAPPIDAKSLADGLDTGAAVVRGDAQTKLNSVRGMLNDTADPTMLSSDPAVLHQTRRAIDGMLKAEQDSNVVRVLTQARQELDGLLGTNVPGMKELDSKYAELGSQERALDRGQTVLDNGREAPWPQVLADEVAAGAIPPGSVVGPSGVAFRLSQGARGEIERLVGTKLNDRAALNGLLKGESDWNADRLSTLFGREKVDRLYKVLDNERSMAETENMALANSKTAGVQAAQQEIQGAASSGNGALRSAGNFKFGDAAATLLDKATGGLSQYRRDSINQDIAEALMGRGDLSVTSGASRRLPEGNAGIGALISTIMQAAKPAPAQGSVAKGGRAVTDEEYRQAILQGFGA